MNEFSIVWLPMSPATVRLVAALGAKETIHLPLFLCGSDLTTFKQIGEINDSMVPLLYGILFGASENPPPPADLQLSSRYFAKALDLMAADRKMPDIETMIVNNVADIRKVFGHDLSAHMLKNGLRFVPESSKVRNDYILDLWIDAAERNEPDHLNVLRDIVSMLKKIDYKALYATSTMLLSYIATVAFLEVDPSGADKFVSDNFTADNLNWNQEWREKIAEYKATKRFSWKALSVQHLWPIRQYQHIRCDTYVPFKSFVKKKNNKYVFSIHEN